jgi:hypothetical protein
VVLARSPFRLISHLGASIALVAMPVACTGSVESLEELSEAAEGDKEARDRDDLGDSRPGTVKLARLTLPELANTLGDLLFDGVRVEIPANMSADIPGDTQFKVGAAISSVEADDIASWMGGLATLAMRRADRIVPCAGSPAANRAAEDACARALITTFGARAYRRPLDQAEIDALFDYYASSLRGTMAYDFITASTSLVHVMLQSPRFLYHGERGSEPATVKDGRIQLGPYELASRLSYLLWATRPDQALFDAARSEKLSGPAEIETQVRRMLADARGRRIIEDFHMQWLKLEALPEMNKDASKYSFSPALGEAMLRETRRFVRWVFDNGGRVEDLLTSNTTFLDDAALAKLYLVGGVATGSAVKQVELRSQERAGILTQASFLASHTLPSELNAIVRGDAIAHGFLCQPPPPPPPDIPPASTDPNLPARERLRQHAQNECAGCHRLIDPLGLAFEGYDGIGRFRTTDAGMPVDTS